MVQPFTNRPFKDNRAPFDITSSWDLPKKLSYLMKVGVGRTPDVKPRKIDPSTSAAHKTKLQVQFEKATNDYYMRLTEVDPDRMRAYEDFEAMEYCLAGETLIATPTGFIRIDELAEMGRDHEFIVYAYDHNEQRVVPAIARNAHQTRIEKTYKVVFDDGSHIIGTADHRLMLRDGSFKKIIDLEENDSMMPFYRKDNFYPQHRYNFVYTCNSNIGWNGWISEHRLIAEWAEGRDLAENEVVHHIDSVGKNNHPDNLMIMDKSEHAALHARRNARFWRDPVKKAATATKISKALLARNFSWNGKRAGKNNPAYIHIPWDVLIDAATEHRTLKKTAMSLGVSYRKIQRDIVENGYADWQTFLKAYGIKKNPYSTATATGDKITLNHKVVSVSEYKTIPVYDFTVPGYKNFATDTVFSHNTPEIASALDIYADECLTENEWDEVLQIKTTNSRIKLELERLFYDVLDIKRNLWGWVRASCKYGNHYLLLDIDDENGQGVTGHMSLPAREMTREEAYDGNLNSVRFRWETLNQDFDAWQIVHFRLLNDDKRYPYGTSMLESARRIWKQLSLAEDAMIVYRLTRAPERRVFKIDVGNIDPNDVEQYMQKVKKVMKRTPSVEHSTGNVTFKYNVMSVDEDFFIPVRGDRSSDIDTLAGASNMDQIADIEYLQQKMFAAMKIPKAFLTYEEDINAKATLAGQDSRFARTIQRIQGSIVAELHKIALIHLYAIGIRDRDQLSDFDLVLTNPNTALEQENLELMSTRASTIKDLWDETALSPVSLVWALRTIMNFTDQEIKLILKQQFLEGKINLKFEDENTPDFEKDAGGADQNGVFGSSEVDAPPIRKNEGFNPLSHLSEIDKRIDMMISLSYEPEYKTLTEEETNPLVHSNNLNNAKTIEMIKKIDSMVSKKVDLSGVIRR